MVFDWGRSEMVVNSRLEELEGRIGLNRIEDNVEVGSTGGGKKKESNE